MIVCVGKTTGKGGGGLREVFERFGHVFGALMSVTRSESQGHKPVVRLVAYLVEEVPGVFHIEGGEEVAKSRIYDNLRYFL